MTDFISAETITLNIPQVSEKLFSYLSKEEHWAILEAQMAVREAQALTTEAYDILLSAEMRLASLVHFCQTGKFLLDEDFSRELAHAVAPNYLAIVEVRGEFVPGFSPENCNCITCCN